MDVLEKTEEARVRELDRWSSCNGLTGKVIPVKSGEESEAVASLRDILERAGIAEVYFRADNPFGRYSFIKGNGHSDVASDCQECGGIVIGSPRIILRRQAGIVGLDYFCPNGHHLHYQNTGSEETPMFD